MKKKNGGFIATSLIYSFFLVFIAIIAALLNNYVANKRILDRFNEDAEKELNMDTYEVTIISKNASIRDGIILTNILENSDFSNTDNSFWNFNGNFSNPIGHVEKQLGANPSDHIYQNFILKNGVKYYYSLEYQTASESTYYVKINDSIDDTLSTLELSGSQGTAKRISNVYESEVGDQNASFTIGESNSSVIETEIVEFTHAMLINLTDAFGTGNEPVPAWIDRNISWFDGTIGIKNFKLSKGVKSLDITFVPYENYGEYEIYCNGSYENGDNISTPIDESGGGTLTFKNIEQDLICTVEWKEQNEE